MRPREGFFIGGAWVMPRGGDAIAVINPATEAMIGEVAAGTASDVDAAVEAAQQAFASWSRTAVATRAALLSEVAAGLRAQQAEIGDTIALEMGMPVKQARAIQATLPATHFTNYARLLRTYKFAHDAKTTRIVQEPIGVCGLITPWNFPLHQIAGKVAPALAAGCTVVLKPSEVAPRNAIILAEVLAAAGLPPGVFNLVHGTGPVVGAALAAHPGIDMISFTGSTRAGISVAKAAAESVKRVSQELGGKSANILLHDAPFPKAVAAGVRSCFFNSGQACNAPTRMLVPAERQAEAIAIAHSTAAALRMGDPFEPGVHLGPLVNATQRDKVASLILRGIEEGATLVCGGPERPADLERGYFVTPTVFADVRNDMTIAREEIFGPVLAILPYEDEDEAVAIANDTPYGLSAYISSADMGRARRVAARLRAGQVHLNDAPFDPEAPFGGYKASGNGREFGTWGLEEFLETKAIIGYGRS